MKRILVIENDSMPESEVDIYIDHILEEGDMLKEINYAQSNTPVVAASIKEMMEATEAEDKFLIVLASTFQDRGQLHTTLTYIKSLVGTIGINPEFHISMGEYNVRKLIYGPSWTIDKEVKELVEYFLDQEVIYSFYVPSVYTGEEVRTVEEIKLLNKENLIDGY